MKIVIFGGGLQGKVIADNLAARPEKPQVVIADIAKLVVKEDKSGRITHERVDVLNLEQVKEVTKDADVCILAVPSAIAHESLNNLLKCGKPIVDVSFTPDPPLSLNQEAIKSGACCVVDCGIAPGLSHILVSHAYEELGGLDEAKIYVGGVPQNPADVFNHAIYFNPQDLIAEYVRPARARVKGQDIAPHPLQADIEPFKDKELGEMEAFLSDGLRSLLTSFPEIPDMSERTLRWAGHLETMKNLWQMGFFADDHIPQTARVLNESYPASKFEDCLLMTVMARKGNKTKTYRLLDKHTDNISAMSRTTGFTTAATAMILARGQFTQPGVHAPEVLGKDKAIVSAILEDLAERGVKSNELVGSN